MNVEATARLFALGTEIGERGNRWCYIAGPMRGRPGLNREAFDRAAKTLRSYGWHVFNPSETDAEVKGAAEASPNPLSVYMQQDLVDVCKSDVVFVLAGWTQSEGADLEVTTATKLGIPVYSFPEILKLNFWTGKSLPLVHPENEFSRRVLDYVKPNGEATTKRFDHEKGHLVDSGYHANQHNVHPVRAVEIKRAVERHPAIAAQVADEYASLRQFSSGATRNPDTNKPDLEGFISPLVVEEFGRYMHEHRLQADGTLRSSDNWQKGIPLEAYMKSMWRHFLHVWLLHRGHEATDYDTGEPVSLQDALCGLLFNVQGYLLETLKAEQEEVA